jgi:hypothetical protein
LLLLYKSSVTAKQREMGTGSLNVVSLATARDMALECRRQVLGGLDPERRLFAHFQDQDWRLEMERPAIIILKDGIPKVRVDGV